MNYLDWDDSIGSELNGTPIEFTYSYDSSGNVKTLAGAESYSYDLVGRLTEIAFDAGAKQQYSFDTYGNITETRIYQGSPPAWETRDLTTSASSNHLSSATYDARGNLTSYGDQTYTFDLFNNLKQLQGGGKDERYLYTADDERIAVRQFFDATHETRNDCRPHHSTRSQRIPSDRKLGIERRNKNRCARGDRLFRESCPPPLQIEIGPR